jgi:hypothetical protein
MLLVLLMLSSQSLCAKIAVVCGSIPLSTLLQDHTAQMAIVSVQLAWTAQVTNALDMAKTQKGIIAETAKHQVMQLAELSSWCLSDVGSQLMRCRVHHARVWMRRPEVLGRPRACVTRCRTKLETVVTIQVHQRDVFTELARLHRERKVQVGKARSAARGRHLIPVASRCAARSAAGLVGLRVAEAVQAVLAAGWLGRVRRRDPLCVHLRH